VQIKMTINTNYFTNGQLNGPASFDQVSRDTASLGIRLPLDYLHFLCEHNGGEGLISKTYVRLWKADELRASNEAYEVKQNAPGILLFGSNGGGEAFGFDTRDAAMPVVRIPFVGMDRSDAIIIASSFTDFLAKCCDVDVANGE